MALVLLLLLLRPIYSYTRAATSAAGREVRGAGPLPPRLMGERGRCGHAVEI